MKISCLVCKSKFNTLVAEQKDIRFNQNEVFKIFKCYECDLLFTVDRLNEDSIKKYYPKSYSAYKFDMKTNIFLESKTSKLKNYIWINFANLKFLALTTSNLLYKIFYKLLVILLNLIGKESFNYKIPPKNRHSESNMLYLGSGNPDKMFYYKYILGFDITVLDINQEVIEYYNRNNIAAINKTIKNASFKIKEFDLIIGSHVLEHLFTPLDEIINLKSWLKDDGLLILSFPNYSSLEWKRKPIYFDVPRHRSHFSKKAAENLFEIANLKTKFKTCIPYGYGFAQSKALKRFNNGEKILNFNKLTKVQKTISLFLTFFGNSGNIQYYLVKK